jgi:hypothetical protein
MCANCRPWGFRGLALLIMAGISGRTAPRQSKRPDVAAAYKDSLEAAKDMTSLFGRALAVAAFSLAATVASAQESTNRVATMTDWNVFTEESPKECWGVSKPKESVNSRDGQPVSVRRGDILLFVTFRPGKPGEISFTGGYPFASGSTVDVTVDGQPYQLFPRAPITQDRADPAAQAARGGPRPISSAPDARSRKTCRCAQGADRGRHAGKAGQDAGGAGLAMGLSLGRARFRADDQPGQGLPRAAGRPFHDRVARGRHPPDFRRWHPQVSGAHRRRA